MKKLLFILMTWFGFVSVQAQTVSYPHELFDPFGIPQVKEARSARDGNGNTGNQAKDLNSLLDMFGGGKQ